MAQRLERNRKELMWLHVGDTIAYQLHFASVTVGPFVVLTFLLATCSFYAGLLLVLTALTILALRTTQRWVLHRLEQENLRLTLISWIRAVTAVPLPAPRELLSGHAVAMRYVTDEDLEDFGDEAHGLIAIANILERQDEYSFRHADEFSRWIINVNLTLSSEIPSSLTDVFNPCLSRRLIRPLDSLLTAIELDAKIKVTRVSNVVEFIVGLLFGSHGSAVRHPEKREQASGAYFAMANEALRVLGSHLPALELHSPFVKNELVRKLLPASLMEDRIVDHIEVAASAVEAIADQLWPHPAFAWDSWAGGCDIALITASSVRTALPRKTYASLLAAGLRRVAQRISWLACAVEPSESAIMERRQLGAYLDQILTRCSEIIVAGNTADDDTRVPLLRAAELAGDAARWVDGSDSDMCRAGLNQLLTSLFQHRRESAVDRPGASSRYSSDRAEQAE